MYTATSLLWKACMRATDSGELQCGRFACQGDLWLTPLGSKIPRPQEWHPCISSTYRRLDLRGCAHATPLPLSAHGVCRLSPDVALAAALPQQRTFCICMATGAPRTASSSIAGSNAVPGPVYGNESVVKGGGRHQQCAKALHHFHASAKPAELLHKLMLGEIVQRFKCPKPGGFKGEVCRHHRLAAQVTGHQPGCMSTYCHDTCCTCAAWPQGPAAATHFHNNMFPCICCHALRNQMRWNLRRCQIHATFTHTHTAMRCSNTHRAVVGTVREAQ